MQQLQGHFAVNTQQATKAFAIGSEFIVVVNVVQLLLQFADIEFEIRQFLHNIKRPFRQHVMAFDIGAAGCGTA